MGKGVAHVVFWWPCCHIPVGEFRDLPHCNPSGFGTNILLNFNCCRCCSLLPTQATLLTLALLYLSTFTNTKCKPKFQSVSFNRAMLDVPVINRTGRASLNGVFTRRLWPQPGVKSVEHVLPQTQEIHMNSDIGITSREAIETPKLPLLLWRGSQYKSSHTLKLLDSRILSHAWWHWSRHAGDIGAVILQKKTYAAEGRPADSR